jgi:Mn-dependent DtxR family transcriptional regulator
MNHMNSRETQMLKVLWRKGGKATINELARAMSIDSDYARLIALDSGEKDYIDVSKAGVCKMTKKGKGIIKHRGFSAKVAPEQRKSERGGSKMMTLRY